MRITVIAVGKLKERFWKEACAEYLKRLSGYHRVAVVEVVDRDPSACGGEERAREREAQDILKAVPANDRCILLAIDGVQRTSEALSAHLDELAVSGVGSVTFVIGGSTGVAPSVRARADELVSLGKITLPHNLARVVLREQLYRCAKISKGEPYHK